MTLPGETIIAGRVPGERIETSILTADSAGVTTTETIVQDITAALVAGRTYKIGLSTNGGSTVAGDTMFWRIREDNALGTALQFERQRLDTAENYPYKTETEYTAVATGPKTFVVTIARSTGTGSVRLDAAGSAPSILYVDYNRG